MSPIEIAKKTAHIYLTKKEIFSLAEDLVLPELKKKAAVFVSIKSRGELRGCIGTIFPTKETIAEEIISNTISALNDYRFLSIKKEEIENLSYEVHLLKEMKLVKKEKINPKTEGILVSCENKKGLLLPGVIDSPKKQLEIAKRKAGINNSENYQIFKFKTEKYVGN